MWFNPVRSIITINPTDTWIKFQLIDGYKPLLFIFCHSNGNHGNGIITEWNVLWLVRTNKYINMNMYYCNARCIIDVYRKKVVTITAGKQVEETNLILVFQLNFCVVDPPYPLRTPLLPQSSPPPPPPPHLLLADGWNIRLMFWYILSFQFYTRIATPKWLVNLLNNLLFIITVEIFFLSCWGSFFFITNISYSINNRQKNSFIFINQFFYHCVLHSFKNWMKGIGCFSYKRSGKKIMEQEQEE